MTLNIPGSLEKLIHAKDYETMVQSNVSGDNLAKTSIGRRGKSLQHPVFPGGHPSKY